jgi:hypothetical protein
MTPYTRRTCLRACFITLLVGSLMALCGTAISGTVPRSPDCNAGEILLNGSPVLSLPQHPSYAGNAISSTGGAWSICGGGSFTGYYAEWLRDGTVISGPNWTLGPPGTFSHTIVSADGNHAIRSAVDPCDDEGCYPSFAQSSPISPIGCTSGGPPAGYVHAGTFAYVSGTTDEAVSMKVESDMSLIPSTAYDHVQATVGHPERRRHALQLARSGNRRIR